MLSYNTKVNKYVIDTYYSGKMYENVPGFKCAMKLRPEGLEVKEGKCDIDKEKLYRIIKENMRIGEEQTKRMNRFYPFLGFGMIMDDTGILVIGDNVVIVDARATNWSEVFNTMRRVMAK